MTMMTVMLIAMLTGITVWWLLIQRLKDKPWLTQGVIPASQDTVTSSAPKVGLWAFLAVVSSLFGLFASAYAMRMHGHGGACPRAPPPRTPHPWGQHTIVLVRPAGALDFAKRHGQRPTR